MTTTNKDELRIYGSSDDLIEFEGCIRDEIGAYNGDINFELSDGSIVRVYWDDSIGWQNQLVRKGKFEVEEIPGNEEEDTTPITVIKGKIDLIWWYDKEDKVNFLTDLTINDLNKKQTKIYDIITAANFSDEDIENLDGLLIGLAITISQID